MKNPYENCQIINIRRGRGDRCHLVYAHLVDPTGRLIMSGTLTYIMDVLTQALPKDESS